MAKKKSSSDFYNKNKMLIIIGIVGLLIVGLIIVNNMLKPGYTDVYNEKPIKGDEEAKVMILEYSDYQCPACKQAYFVVEQLIDEYDGAVSVEYKHFPLREIHPYAQKAAEAAECANDQGKFWEYTDLLFKNSPQLSKSNLKEFARQLGLNSSFDACLDSGAKELIVNADYNEAVSKNLRGTPSFFVNGKEMQWVQGLSLYDNLKTMIDSELEKN